MQDFYFPEGVALHDFDYQVSMKCGILFHGNDTEHISIQQTTVLPKEVTIKPVRSCTLAFVLVEKQ